jgi:hypothetical protein
MPAETTTLDILQLYTQRSSASAMGEQGACLVRVERPMIATGRAAWRNGHATLAQQSLADISFSGTPFPRLR